MPHFYVGISVPTESLFLVLYSLFQEKLFPLLDNSVMKLDTSHLRYLSDNDFRVLTAVPPSFRIILISG
jgi:hypothetical protein